MRVTEVLVERVSGEGPDQFSVLLYGIDERVRIGGPVTSWPVRKAVLRLGLNPASYKQIACYDVSRHNAR